jgi:hypothetical protein
MRISRSLRRKVLATVLGALAFSLVYEATVIDSRTVPLVEAAALTPTPGARMEFHATAYCKGHTSASGAPVLAGFSAADP